MKNDIDSLLEAMFRNGKLRTGPKKAGESSGTPQLTLEPGTSGPEAQKAMEAMRQLNAKTSASLQRSIEELTAETKNDLAELEQHLKKDGVQEGPAGNNGSPRDLEAAFEAAREEAARQVLGQDEFLSALTIALKRPFVAGSGAEAPFGRILIKGKAGTGRHSALSALTAGLGRRGVLKSPKLAVLDLAAYGEPGSEKLLIQDLYAALKSGASGLIFENFEKCHSSVLPLVAELFREGKASLPGRYAEQKGMLVDIGTALVAGAVSSLSAAGKYLFLLTDKSEARLADAFGMPFLSAMDDICETRDFSPEALRAIGERDLEELCKLAEKQLSFQLTWEPSGVEALCGAFDLEEGAGSLREEADRLYRALSEWKLRQGIPEAQGTVRGEDGVLQARCRSGEKEAVLKAKEEQGAAAREAAVEAVKQELAEIVGLESVKEYILSLEDNFKIQQLRREKGLKAESPSMHMIFTGNPGTGKTTVARIVSRYLKAIGVLSGGQLIEVTRADLVGQYVGHTAPLTNRAIQSALGGVLFIDEAYSLYRGRDDSFGLEAIDTLVKGMEDHRDSLVVILAGYSREMEEFLEANSGLRSRFPNIIEFADYTARELVDITKSIVKGKGYRLDPGCEEALLNYYAKRQKDDPRTGGNGRMARNKVEEAVLNCSRRNVRTPEDQRDLELLLPCDFELE